MDPPAVDPPAPFPLPPAPAPNPIVAQNVPAPAAAAGVAAGPARVPWQCLLVRPVAPPFSGDLPVKTTFVAQWQVTNAGANEWRTIPSRPRSPAFKHYAIFLFLNSVFIVLLSNALLIVCVRTPYPPSSHVSCPGRVCACQHRRPHRAARGGRAFRDRNGPCAPHAGRGPDGDYLAQPCDAGCLGRLCTGGEPICCLCFFLSVASVTAAAAESSD
jgi:hypothetical protein